MLHILETVMISVCLYDITRTARILHGPDKTYFCNSQSWNKQFLL